MLKSVAPGALFQSRTHLMRVLVLFGHPGLVLDRPPHSVTLEAPLHNVRECLR
jgi:hypothetical protein